jgi:hypothetical protein
MLSSSIFEGMLIYSLHIRSITIHVGTVNGPVKPRFLILKSQERNFRTRVHDNQQQALF